ncbi:hypothetical protein [Gordonia soli]|uniref:C2H2-type domain-containing protein n=1 Tax=Gordonia soli NBRC 108243 TaxID=1223545 RepID=M0QRQ7_9ACTN|nr:hypothetical protein [Gordonia soli]GAC71081.1 hypothetical protein GS4_51_00190 [Gordonia soli NBRC 108243]
MTALVVLALVLTAISTGWKLAQHGTVRPYWCIDCGARWTIRNTRDGHRELARLRADHRMLPEVTR